MIGLLARNWGWIALRGIAAILFGVLALARPGITLAVLVLFWGAYALADGVFALIAAFRIREDNKPMWPLLLVGIIGIAAGVLTLMYPGITATVLLAFIAAWAIIAGIFQIVAAIRLRKVISNEWIMGLSGALSLAFGLLMFARPGAGALAVIWTIAWFAILYGVMLVMLAFRLKGLAAHVPKLA
jgi:uncharacterized membrane protein HdeD (DUF308 family)